MQSNGRTSRRRNRPRRAQARSGFEVAATRRRTATSFVLPGKVDSQSPQWAAQRNRTPPIIPDPGREPVSRNVRIARTRGGRQASGVAERPEIGPLCNVPAFFFFFPPFFSFVGARGGGGGGKKKHKHKHNKKPPP